MSAETSPPARRTHNDLRPAILVPPGEILADELAERSWTQRQFAAILERPVQTVNAIIRGKKAITPETARDIAAALGMDPQLWINLETNYRLWLSDTPDARRRAKP